MHVLLHVHLPNFISLDTMNLCKSFTFIEQDRSPRGPPAPLRDSLIAL